MGSIFHWYGAFECRVAVGCAWSIFYGGASGWYHIGMDLWPCFLFFIGDTNSKMDILEMGK